uniref:Uncharacterized protein n=1 Tax=Anguilla anguilla TaxID=7936 RepID=A0A0E9XLQ8_ANGAN
MLSYLQYARGGSGKMTFNLLMFLTCQYNCMCTLRNDVHVKRCSVSSDWLECQCNVYYFHTSSHNPSQPLP